MRSLPPLSRTAHWVRLRDPLDLVETHQRTIQELRWGADGNAVRSTTSSDIMRARQIMALVLMLALVLAVALGALDPNDAFARVSVEEVDMD